MPEPPPLPRPEHVPDLAAEARVEGPAGLLPLLAPEVLFLQRGGFLAVFGNQGVHPLHLRRFRVRRQIGEVRRHDQRVVGLGKIAEGGDVLLGHLEVDCVHSAR